MIKIQAKQHLENIVLRVSSEFETVEKKPFHLVLMLDTSGSMEGRRISALKKTLDVMIDNISDADKLTLIEYNSTAKVLCSAESSKEVLKSVVAALDAGDGTCLESAILKLNEIKQTIPVIDGVFILTDGQINHGIRSIGGISNMLKTVVPSNVPISTVGYGSDHNAKLLQKLAVDARGTYTFAEEDETLPAIVGNIMTGLQDILAKEFTVHLNKFTTTCLELGYTPGSESYLVGAIIANKDQWVVLQNLSNDAPVTVKVNWHNIRTDEYKTEHIEIETDCTESEIEEQVWRAKAVGLMNVISSYMNQSDIPKLQELQTKIKGSSVADRSLMISLCVQIQELIDLLETGPSVHDNSAYTRLVSDMTTFGLQRGYTGRMEDEDNFASPRQRLVTASLVNSFSQRPVE
jgi:hypothetical protein